MIDDSALAASVQKLNEKSFFTKPGRVLSYSNPGFSLAGYVLERLTGKPYADAVDDLILKPLGADHTRFRPMAALTYPFAVGHRGSSAVGFTVIRPMAFSADSGPTGGAFSSATDTARFAQMLLNDGRSASGVQVISPAVLEQMTTPHIVLDESGGAIHYGYGLFVEPGAKPVWFHGGGLSGFNASVAIRPEADVAVVVIVNGGDNAIVEDVKNIVLRQIGAVAPANPSSAQPKTPSQPRAAPVAISPGLAAELVGRWGQGDWVFTVKQEGEDLIYAVNGAVLGKLYSEGPDMLALITPSGAPGGNVALLRGEDGRVDLMTWSVRATSRLPDA